MSTVPLSAVLEELDIHGPTVRTHAPGPEGAAHHAGDAAARSPPAISSA